MYEFALRGFGDESAFLEAKHRQSMKSVSNQTEDTAAKTPCASLFIPVPLWDTALGQRHDGWGRSGWIARKEILYRIHPVIDRQCLPDGGQCHLE